MTATQLISRLRKPGRAYAWIRVTEHDGYMIRLTKADLISELERAVAARGNFATTADIIDNDIVIG